jgi:hypothetical protein
MGQCKCGFSTDPENNCNGTHNVVKAVKEDILAKIDEIDIDAGKLNALGFKMLLVDSIKGKK